MIKTVEVVAVKWWNVMFYINARKNSSPSPPKTHLAPTPHLEGSSFAPRSRFCTYLYDDGGAQDSSGKTGGAAKLQFGLERPARLETPLHHGGGWTEERERKG